MRRKQQGSIVLFVSMFILPVFFFLLTMSVDLTQYFGEGQKLEEIFDDAALLGARNLPNQSMARVSAQEFLLLKGIGISDIITETTADTISIRFEGRADVSFARLFGITEGVLLSVYSRARTTPADAFVLIDSSDNLAPAPGGIPWGEPTEWPELSFFREYSPFGVGEEVPDERILSQQCLNPIFLPIKYAGLRLVDALSASPSNSVGVGFFPGVRGGLDIVRANGSSGDRIQELDTAYFDASSGPHSSNSVCLAAIERESGTVSYWLPANAYTEEEENHDRYRVDEATWSVDTDALSSLSVRDLIWSRAVRSGVHGDISAGLSEIQAQLLGGREIQSERGNLAGNAAKVGIVFLGDLPSINGERYPAPRVRESIRGRLLSISTSLEELTESMQGGNLSQSSIFRLYFIISPNLLGFPTADEVSAFENFIRGVIAESRQGRFAIDVIRAEATSGQLLPIMNNIVSQTRTIVLSR